jgi:hypothetical protein
MSGGLDGVLTDLGLARDDRLQIVGNRCPAALDSPLAVADCAIVGVAACLTAAADLAVARGGRRPAITLDTGHVAAAVRSEALLRDPTGSAVDGFAPLSRLWPTADGWLRTHANYPWHRATLLNALGVKDGPDDAVKARLADTIANRPAREIELAAYEAGGLAVAARTEAEWRAENVETKMSPLVTTTPGHP